MTLFLLGPSSPDPVASSLLCRTLLGRSLGYDCMVVLEQALSWGWEGFVPGDITKSCCLFNRLFFFSPNFLIHSHPFIKFFGLCSNRISINRYKITAPPTMVLFVFPSTQRSTRRCLRRSWPGGGDKSPVLSAKEIRKEGWRGGAGGCCGERGGGQIEAAAPTGPPL